MVVQRPKKLTMSFSLPLFAISNRTPDMLFETKEIGTSTNAGAFINGIPPDPRHTMPIYALQKGTYLDFLTGLSRLFGTLKGAMTAEASKVHLTMPDDVKLVIPQF